MNRPGTSGPPEAAFSRLRLWALVKLSAGLYGIYLLRPSGLFGTWGKLHETTNTLHSVPVQWLINMGKLVPTHFADWLMSIPFLVLGIGLLELVANRPFWKIALAWDQMDKVKHDWLVFIILSLAIGGIILAAHLCLLRAGGTWNSTL